MPTYAYACTACEHRFEVHQAFTDAALTECPECAGRLRKLFNSVGIVFKGSGFYRTDSRSADGKATAAASADKPADKADKADKKGEAAASSSSSSSSSSDSSGSSSSAASSSSSGSSGSSGGGSSSGGSATKPASSAA